MCCVTALAMSRTIDLTACACLLLRVQIIQSTSILPLALWRLKIIPSPSSSLCQSIWLRSCEKSCCDSLASSWISCKYPIPVQTWRTCWTGRQPCNSDRSTAKLTCMVLTVVLGQRQRNRQGRVCIVPKTGPDPFISYYSMSPRFQLSEIFDVF